MRRFALSVAVVTVLAAGILGIAHHCAADDQQIAQAIAAKLREHQQAGRLKGFDIDLNVEDGKVTLIGNVVDEEQHKIAIDSARFVPGVQVVVNDLKIQGQKAEHHSQQQNAGTGIAGLLAGPSAFGNGQQQAASGQPNLAAGESRGLLADLRNRGAGQQQEVQTTAASSQVPVNAEPADHEIAAAVVQKLRDLQANGQLVDFEIDVKVTQGRVALMGNVTDEQQHQLAIEAARYVPGVKVVINDVKIQGEKFTHPEQQSSVPATQLAGVPRPAQSIMLPPASQPQPPALSVVPFVKIERTQPTATIAANTTPVAQTPVAQTAIAQTPVAATPIAQTQVETQQMSEPVAQTQPETVAVQPQTQVATAQAEESIAWQPRAVAVAHQPTIQVAPLREEQLAQASANDVAIAPPLPELPQSIEQPIAQPVAQEIAEPQLPEQYLQAPQAAQPVIAQPVIARPVARQVARPQMVAYPAAYPQMQMQMAPAYGPQPGYPQMAMAPQMQPMGGQQMAYQQGMRPMMVGGAPIRLVQAVQPQMQMQAAPMQPAPQYIQGTGQGVIPARYDHPQMPGYAWPSYAAYPNYAALQYPKQYSAHAWPYIGPFYPYPQVPLGWRKVTLTWDDGWWMLDFKDKGYGPYIAHD